MQLNVFPRLKGQINRFIKIEERDKKRKGESKKKEEGNKERKIIRHTHAHTTPQNKKKYLKANEGSKVAEGQKRRIDPTLIKQKIII